MSNGAYPLKTFRTMVPIVGAFRHEPEDVIRETAVWVARDGLDRQEGVWVEHGEPKFSRVDPILGQTVLAWDEEGNPIGSPEDYVLAVDLRVYRTDVEPEPLDDYAAPGAGMEAPMSRGVFNTSWFVPGIATIVALYVGEIVDRWQRMMRHIRRYGRGAGPRHYRFDERGRMTPEDGERW